MVRNKTKIAMVVWVLDIYIKLVILYSTIIVVKVALVWRCDSVISVLVW